MKFKKAHNLTSTEINAASYLVANDEQKLREWRSKWIKAGVVLKKRVALRHEPVRKKFVDFSPDLIDLPGFAN